MGRARLAGAAELLRELAAGVTSPCLARNSSPPSFQTLWFEKLEALEGRGHGVLFRLERERP